MAQVGFNAAKKRYHRIFWPAMAAYVAIVLTGAWIVDKETTPKWIAGSIAVATAIPVCIALWAIVRWMSETDEYTRIKHLKGFARGAALTNGASLLLSRLTRLIHEKSFCCPDPAAGGFCFRQG